MRRSQRQLRATIPRPYMGTDMHMHTCVTSCLCMCMYTYLCSTHIYICRYTVESNQPFPCFHVYTHTHTHTHTHKHIVLISEWTLTFSATSVKLTPLSRVDMWRFFFLFFPEAPLGASPVSIVSPRMLKYCWYMDRRPCSNPLNLLTSFESWENKSECGQ